MVILDEKNYYPFGLEHKGYNNVVSANVNSVANKYTFNGQPFDESLSLNLQEMTFRQYDSALGRFNVSDPLSENFHDWTPYRFGFNNPAYWADPTGLIEESVLLEIFSRSSSGTVWKNDGHSGFYTDDGGYVGYTSDDTSFNLSPGSETALPGVEVIEKNERSYSKAASLMWLNIYATKWYRKEAPQLRQYTPNWREKWAKSDNFIGSFTYNFANDAFQVAQIFDFGYFSQTNPLTGMGANSNIDGSANYKSVEGLTNIAATAVPIGRGTKVVASTMPKGLAYVQKLNAVQFNKLFKGKLPKMSHKLRGRVNVYMNKAINWYNGQVPTGMILLKSKSLKTNKEE
ncbi:MAG: hypothetical protein OIF50_03185 [Flavobacteriaceae bacterium]|nr:hypothetical protein [Flavobacteriaceae bacterium]